MSSPPPPPRTIRVGDLDIAQLADVKKQLDDVSMWLLLLLFWVLTQHPPTQELAHLASSFSQLRQAQAKFKACIHSITQIKPRDSRAHFVSFSWTHS